MIQEEHLAGERYYITFVSRLHLLPDDKLISDFLIKSREHTLRMTSLYSRKRENGPMTSYILLCSGGEAICTDNGPNKDHWV